MRNSVDVHNFLLALGVEHEIVLIEGEPRDLSEAAAMCGLPPDHLTETHLFEVDGRPVMVLAPAGKVLDASRVARTAGGTSCRPLSVTEIRRLTGFFPGLVPPVATVAEMELLVDDGCGADGCLYSSAGDRGAILKMRMSDLLALRREGRIVRLTGE